MRTVLVASIILGFPVLGLVFGAGSCLQAAADTLPEQHAAEAAALAGAERDQRLDAGRHHTCLVREDGKVICWGSNVGRQLGHDRLPKANAPTVVPNLGNVLEVAAGAAHTCVRNEDMDVECWGGKHIEAQAIKGLRDAIGIAAGGRESCAVEHDGRVLCWNMYDSPVTPSPVKGVHDALEVAVGERHACARTQRGKVKCWGSNRFGQLGDGRARFRAGAALVDGLNHVIDIAAGKSHTCALRFDGSVACWGWGGRGQLGVGTLADANRPRLVQDLGGPATEIAIGADFSCARLNSGRVQCWGSAAQGQLGHGIADEDAMFGRPVWVTGIEEATALTAGQTHACAEINRGAQTMCWGSNTEGQLGEGPQLFRPLPTNNSHITEPVTAIAAGSAHACAVVDGGRVRCWGHNSNWQLGDRAAPRCTTPIEVRDLERAVAVANGGKHTCALLQDGHVACWGTNGRGQMGDARREVRTRVKIVPKLENAVAIEAGLHHTCAITSEKTLMCWGDNRFAQLGDGTRSLKTHPTRVSGVGKEIVDVAAGAKHTCALSANGSVWCWGRNDVGQIGDGSTRNRSKPRQVKGIDGRAVEIASYQNRTCARRDDGAILCWGDHKPKARKVAMWPDATQLTMGVAHVCARENAGTVSCIGNNYSGQLGDGSRIFRPEPFRLSTITDVAEIAAGKRFTCARKEGGSVTCWGDNHFGQLGYAGRKQSAEPIPIAK